MAKSIVMCGMNYAPELTGVGRYTGELARGLARRGWSVTVVTAPPHYPGWYIRDPYSGRRYARSIDDGIKVFRCPIWLSRSARGIKRLLAPLSFGVTSAPVLIATILRNRPACVLCVEPTLANAPLAILAAWLVGARLVLHVQDLEVDAAIAVGHLSLPTPVQYALRWIERVILRRFDIVVTISVAMRQALIAKRLAPDRVAIVRNWVDTNQIAPLDRPSIYRAELAIAPNTFVALYAGQMGVKQALHLVFDAVQAMRYRRDVHFIIAGDGPLKRQFVDQFGALPNLTFLPLQPEVRLSELLNLADVHLLPQDPSVADLVLPSKIGGMLASGRPILTTAAPTTEIASFLGTTAAYCAPDAMTAAIEDLVAAAIRPAGLDLAGRERRALARTISVDSAITAFETILTARQPRESER